MASRHSFSRLKARIPLGAFTKEFSFRLFAIVSWVPAAIFLNNHIAEVAVIGGQSMYPYLNSGFNEDLNKDVCWVDKRNPTENLKRGMIVTLWSPLHPEVLSIKRIIALEGDTVYTRAPYPYPTAVVPLNHIWVEGDNRDSTKTLDSNHYGPVAKPLIQGKVTHVLWPWHSFGAIPWWQFKGRTKVIMGHIDDAPRFD